MKVLPIFAASALLALSAPAHAQISAGVGHKLQEETPSDPAHAKGGGDNKGDLSEGRAAAPDAPVGGKTTTPHDQETTK
ncbi:MAG: hypothetical protein KGM15_11170 [Pseudomonadota bacterium]|nr:hypothetical protein [Pseudomonadota bacterium]